MSAENAYSTLLRLAAASDIANVVLVSETNGEQPMLQRLTLTRELAGEFARIAQGVMPEDVILKPYEPGYKPDDHEILYLRLEDEPDIAALISEIGDVQNVELFAENEEVIAHLKFYGIVIGARPRTQGVFLRTCSKSLELSHGPRIATLMRRGTFGKLAERLFVFDRQVDCYATRGYLFIRNVGNFQRIFKYYEQLREQAAATVDSVARHIPISNLPEFRQACTSQIQMMGKLAAISRKPYLARVQMDDIRRVIDQFQLELTVVNDGGTEKLLFEPGLNKRWLILKLLDDDYLGSVMTNERYEVNSKLALS